MAKGIQITLRNSAGEILANQTDIEVAWLDSDAVIDFSEIKGKSATASTDGFGLLSLDLDDVSGLSIGDWGFLICYKPDGLDYRKSPVFAGRVQLVSVTTGTKLGPLTDWVRNPSWLALPSVTGLQKFAGLHAVYPESNFVALSATGAYTVNWGDGSGNINVSSGVTAERNIAWADAPATSDVGIASAQAVTFTDTGDLVNLTNHGWQNGQVVAFNSITSTTGISTYTHYRVFNKTTNSFQVSAIGNATDAALTLTTDGTGSIYVPQYRQVIVTVVPNGGNILTFNLHVKHSQSLLQAYSTKWLDIAMSFEFMTDLLFAVSLPGTTSASIVHSNIQRFAIENSDLRQVGYLLYFCSVLSSVPKLVTSSYPSSSYSVTFTDATDTINLTGHPFRDGDCIVFTNITSTTGITVGNVYYIRDSTANTFKVTSVYNSSALALTNNGSGTLRHGTSFNAVFGNCRSLRSIPMIDTSNSVTTINMFSSCYSLQSIPLLDTSNVVNISGMFTSCQILQTLPLLDTSKCITYANIFTGCFNLYTIPTINTSLATSLASAFSSCYKLEYIPILNTSSCTNFSSMFSSCYSLKSIPYLDTSNATTVSSMFNNCHSLLNVPLLNTTNTTIFANMFNSCYSITHIPVLNTSAGTSFTSIVSSCSALVSARLNGTPVSITYSGLNLGPEALNEIYRGLKSGVTGQTITVSNNWGTASDDPTIATAKGWTVTG